MKFYFCTYNKAPIYWIGLTQFSLPYPNAEHWGALENSQRRAFLLENDVLRKSNWIPK